MTKVIRSAGLAMLLTLLVTAPLVQGDEPAGKAPEPKTPASKESEQKASDAKPESKKDEKVPAPGQKSQEVKPAEPTKPPEKKEKEEAKKEELRKEKEKDELKKEKDESKKDKEEPKAPASPPKPPETKPAETPTPKPIPPSIIATKLTLMADPHLFPYDINVEISSDAAALSGKVATDSEKAAASEIVQSLEGIKSVTNNIEVVKELAHTISKKKDEIIVQYVKDRFSKSKTLETAHFDVKSEEGVIYLSGKTKFIVIVLEAAEAARQVPGVKAVNTVGIHLDGTD